MLLFVLHEGLETSPEDSCLQLSSQGAKKTSSISHYARRGRACPGELQEGSRQCCSAVRRARCCEQSSTQHGAAAAHGADFTTCSTSALLLAVSVPLRNASEVRTTLGKWWTFALSAFSISAGSNPDLQDSVPLAKLTASCGESQSTIGVQYLPLMATVYRGGNPAFYLLLPGWWTCFTYISIIFKTTVWKIYHYGSKTELQDYISLVLYLRYKLIKFPQGQGECFTFRSQLIMKPKTGTMLLVQHDWIGASSWIRLQLYTSTEL